MTQHSLSDQLLLAALAHVPHDGWSRMAWMRGAEDLRVEAAEAGLLFPGGAAAMIARHSTLADERMLLVLADQSLSTLKIRERILTAVRKRLEQAEPHREAVRQALAVLALPGNVGLGSRLLWNTADVIWQAAGDTATDWNYYSKRFSLSGVYGTTLLYWLNDPSEDQADTWAFLERRINDVLKLMARRRKMTDDAAKILHFPLRRVRAMRRFKERSS